MGFATGFVHFAHALMSSMYSKLYLYLEMHSLFKSPEISTDQNIHWQNENENWTFVTSE